MVKSALSLFNKYSFNHRKIPTIEVDLDVIQTSWEIIRGYRKSVCSSVASNVIRDAIQLLIGDYRSDLVEFFHIYD